jgi:hypothetical protein
MAWGHWAGWRAACDGSRSHPHGPALIEEGWLPTGGHGLVPGAEIDEGELVEDPPATGGGGATPTAVAVADDLFEGQS